MKPGAEFFKLHTETQNPGRERLSFESDRRASSPVQLRARLVVLSCCHSVQRKVSAEGVVGIARAFLGAGARSVRPLWSL